MQKPPLNSNSMSRGCTGVFGACFALFALFFAGVSLLSGGWFMALFALPFLAVGLGLVAWSLVPLFVGVKLAPAEVRLTPKALRPGESFTFSYRQAVKQPVEVTRVTLDFLYRESATYTRGTDTYTDVWDRPHEHYERPGRRYGPGETIADEVTWQVPPDGMHSFSASNNRILWLLKLRLELAGWPDVNEEYTVTVLPERAG